MKEDFFMSLSTLTEDGSYALTNAGYTVLVLVMLAILLAACYFTKADSRAKTGTRRLVFSSAAIALAFVTSFLKIFALPMGGSITLFSMLFIVLIGYWYGLGSGIMAAVAYGLLQMIVDPYIVSIPQMLCDYVFAFGALGLSGVFHNAKHGLIKGYLLGIFGRFVFSFLSGLIFFGQYAPDGMNPAVYSAAYNGSYIAAEGAVTIILLMIPAVSKALGRIKKLATQDNFPSADHCNTSTLL